MTIVSVPGDLPQPKTARLTLISITLAITSLVVWASWAKIDQVTRASAQFIAAERTQVVQSPDGGVVTRLHVKEGDKVNKGQLLVTLEKERASSAVDDSAAKVAALKAAITRLEAELFGRELRFDAEVQKFGEYVRNQTDLYTRRRTALNEETESLQRILSIAEDELKINQGLLQSGDVSRSEVLRLQRAAADIRAQITNRRNK